MKKANTYLKDVDKKKLVADLKQSYAAALKNKGFVTLINTLKIKESIAINYTSKLEKTAEELSACKECPGLGFCKTKITGYVYYPELNNDKLLFSYIPCRYQQEHIKNIKEKEEAENKIPSEIENASMKEIDTTDKKRYDLITKLTLFLENYGNEKHTKGLYVHGSFGSGKTYLVSAALNELKKKNVNTLIIYFASFLRSLKESMEGFGFKDKMHEVLSAEVLLIDDIGAESLSNWSRDEILGSILQHRMENNLTTFFTSNLNLEELEAHLSFTRYKDDKVKARRIIERIKYLTEEVQLISKNKRQ